MAFSPLTKAQKQKMSNIYNEAQLRGALWNFSYVNESLVMYVRNRVLYFGITTMPCLHIRH